MDELNEFDSDMELKEPEVSWRVCDICMHISAGLYIFELSVPVEYRNSHMKLSCPVQLKITNNPATRKNLTERIKKVSVREQASKQTAGKKMCLCR